MQKKTPAASLRTKKTYFFRKESACGNAEDEKIIKKACSKAEDKKSIFSQKMAPAAMLRTNT